MLNFFRKWLYNGWEEIDRPPKWVLKAFWKQIPSPVSRPPEFITYFKGRTFRYKVEYREKSFNNTEINVYRKLRKHKK